jgi:hypothetical protein
MGTTCFPDSAVCRREFVFSLSASIVICINGELYSCEKLSCPKGVQEIGSLLYVHYNLASPIYRVSQCRIFRSFASRRPLGKRPVVVSS